MRLVSENVFIALNMIWCVHRFINGVETAFMQTSDSGALDDEKSATLPLVIVRQPSRLVTSSTDSIPGLVVPEHTPGVLNTDNSPSKQSSLIVVTPPAQKWHRPTHTDGHSHYSTEDDTPTAPALAHDTKAYTSLNHSNNQTGNGNGLSASTQGEHRESRLRPTDSSKL